MTTPPPPPPPAGLAGALPAAGLPAPGSLADAVSRPFRAVFSVLLALLLLGAFTTVSDAGVFAPELQSAWRAVSLLHEAEQGMSDQETGVRGFLLAPPPVDQDFLQPYLSGRTADAEATRELEALHTSEAFRRALAERTRAARDWQEQWVGSALGDAAGKPTSTPFLTQGKTLFDAYRVADGALSDQLDLQVRALLARQRAVTLGGSVLGLLVVLAAVVAVRRTRRRLLLAVATPLADVAAAVRSGREGDLSATVRGADIAELDALAADVTGLFSTLRERDAALRQHAAELQVISAASRALLTDPDPRNAICRAAARISGAVNAFLFEPDGAGSLVDTASIGSPPGELVLPLDGDSLAVRVYRSREPVLVDDVHTDRRVSRSIAEGLPASGGAWIPVLAEGRCLGVLVIGLPVALAATSSTVPEALLVLASEAAAAIDRVDLHERLARQARTDGLTGVANRRTWDTELPAELARTTRSGRPLALAILDLDHFKAYNDSRGHQAGDQLLRSAAHRWAGRLRTTDLLARYGGEEFVLALPDCDLQAAQQLLDELRGLLPDAQTCSVGLTLWDGTESAQSAIGRADAALYEAKRSGRDRVVVRHPRPRPPGHVLRAVEQPAPVA